MFEEEELVVEESKDEEMKDESEILMETKLNEYIFLIDRSGSM